MISNEICSLQFGDTVTQPSIRVFLFVPKVLENGKGFFSFGRCEASRSRRFVRSLRFAEKLWHYGHRPAWPGFGDGPLSGGPTKSTDLRLGDSEVWAFQIWKITSFNESMSIYSILPLYFKIFNKMSKAKIQKDLNRQSFQHNLTTNS